MFGGGLKKILSKSFFLFHSLLSYFLSSYLDSTVSGYWGWRNFNFFFLHLWLFLFFTSHFFVLSPCCLHLIFVIVILRFSFSFIKGMGNYAYFFDPTVLILCFYFFKIVLIIFLLLFVVVSKVLDHKLLLQAVARRMVNLIHTHN